LVANSEIFRGAEQIQSIQVAFAKSFAARRNKYSQFELLLFANCKILRCATEQMQSIGVAVVRQLQNLSLPG
jgi:hypothetical protein